MEQNIKQDEIKATVELFELPPETRRDILGVSMSAESQHLKTLEDLAESDKKLKEASLTSVSEYAKPIYRLTDKLGLTSLNKRTKNELKRLENNQVNVQRRIQYHKKDIEKINSDFAKCRNICSDAKIYVYSYENRLAQISNNIENINNSIMNYKGTLQKDVSDLDIYKKMNTLSREKVKLESERDQIRTNLENASRAYNKHYSKIKLLEVQQAKLKITLHNLEATSQNLDLMYQSRKLSSDYANGGILNDYKMIANHELDIRKSEQIENICTEELNNQLRSIKDSSKDNYVLNVGNAHAEEYQIEMSDSYKSIRRLMDSESI